MNRIAHSAVFAHAVAVAVALVVAASPALPLNAQMPTLQRIFTIGCESCGSTQEFSGITALAISPRGELLVADQETPRLRQFDATGKPVWQGGANGKGPGEYSSITRVGWMPDGGFGIIDGYGNRITMLTKTHAVASSITFAAFATTAATNESGAMVLGTEYRGGKGFELQHLKGATLEKIELPSVNGAAKIKFSATGVAVAPNGTIAVWADDNRYEILRMDAAGNALSPITRGIDRIHYTRVEDSIRVARMNKSLAQMRAMAGAKAAPPTPTGPPPLKPYARGDGTRYDAKGRLWAYTMQGDEHNTIFDVFSPAGTFIGSVKISGVILDYALGGTWLATSTENEDGVLQVTMWTVR